MPFGKWGLLIFIYPIFCHYYCSRKRINIPRLKTIMKEKSFLEKNVRMDAQVAMNINGDINIYPAPWEEDQTPIMSERRVSYRGRITMMDSGQTEVKRYNIGSQMPLYDKLFCTEHCDVLRSQGGQLIEKWKFNNKLSIHQIWEIRKREKPLVDAYFLTIKEDLTWK